MTHPLHFIPDFAAHPARTGLVFGGGGAAGNGWLIGVIAGLDDAGLDVTDADLVVGTSAGSTAAAQLADGTPLPELFAAIVDVAPPPAGAAASVRANASPRGATSHLERLRAIIAASSDAADYRRRVAVALCADAASSVSAQRHWRATVVARFPARSWPRQRLLITAVDARTGDPVVFDRASGVDLVDAVAASCAGGFAYGIGEDRYVDGGYRTNADNADLAAGCARVLVLSPLGGRSLTPVEWGTHLATQVAVLRATGSLVETILPDERSRVAFGDNMMDVSTRPAAAHAGFAQGRAVAERLAGFWR